MDEAPYMTRSRADATARAIGEEDISAAVRGLRLAGMSTSALIATIQTHAAIDMFASAVIVVGAWRRYNLVSDNLDPFTIAELEAIGRDPALLTRSKVETELFRRDQAPALSRFRVPFFREVIANDTLQRTYEAESADAAIQLAIQDIASLNANPPSDAVESSEVVEAKSWQVDHDGVVFA